ncbi:MAG: Helix-turn-helix domain [Tardiphaga sp.]|nr:Helix-turn-helix domain [Tardiphaga sp.]
MPSEDNPSAKSKLAKKLKRHRRAFGLTQRELAEAAQVRRALIIDIEAGEANPTLESLEQIARAMKTDIAGLFSSAD